MCTLAGSNLCMPPREQRRPACLTEHRGTTPPACAATVCCEHHRPAQCVCASCFGGYRQRGRNALHSRGHCRLLAIMPCSGGVASGGGRGACWARAPGAQQQQQLQQRLRQEPGTMMLQGARQQGHHPFAACIPLPENMRHSLLHSVKGTKCRGQGLWWATALGLVSAAGARQGPTIGHIAQHSLGTIIACAALVAPGPASFAARLPQRCHISRSARANTLSCTVANMKPYRAVPGPTLFAAQQPT